MKNHIIDTLGLNVARHTTGFNMGLTGLAASVVYGAAPTAPSTLSQYTREGLSAQAGYLTALAAVIDLALRDVVAAAAEHAGASPDTGAIIGSEFVRQERAELLGALSALAQKNAATAARRVRDFVTRVDLAVMAGRNTMSGALVAARIVEGQAPVSFRVLDTLGRKWKTTDYAAALVKGAMQGIYANTFATIAAEAGVDLVEVIYPDEVHDNHGLLVSLSGAKGRLGFMSVRDEIFHPNSEAQLRPYGGDDVSA